MLRHTGMRGGEGMAGVARTGVLERVTLIMDCLGEAPGYLLLEDVAGITGLPRSTAFRLLSQLTDLAWVRHDAQGYVLGPRLSYRGLSADFEGLRAAARTELMDLAAATGMVAHLGVMRGGFIDYVDRTGAEGQAGVRTRIGTRIYAPESTSGMAILAWLDAAQVDAVIAGAGVERTSGRSALNRELSAVRRRQGIAFQDGRTRPSGVSSVGAAVLGDEGPVGAISLARRGNIPLQSVSPLLLRAADSIAAAFRAGHC